MIGGQRVAQAVLRPNVMDFIELATKSEHLELQIEETEIAAGSASRGQSSRTARFRQDLGIIIVAIKKPDGRMLFNPGPRRHRGAGRAHHPRPPAAARPAGAVARGRAKAHDPVAWLGFGGRGPRPSGAMRAPKTSTRLDT